MKSFSQIVFSLAKMFRPANKNNDAQADLTDASPIDLAEFAMEQENWSEAFKLLNSPDVANNPAALNLLAWLYFYGKGTAKNSSKAIDCLQGAAKQDYWPAICNLARAYQCGIGTKKDGPTALSLFKQAEPKNGVDNVFAILPDHVSNPSDNYLDECWLNCQQWKRHIEDRQRKQWNSREIRKEPEFQRYERISGIQSRYGLNTGGPIGWGCFVLALLCRITLTAIVLFELLPYVPGFAFLGDINDALRLALIFYVVNQLVSISGLIAIPLYILCIAVLIYLGCDLPIIGLIVTPFLASLFKVWSNLFSKHLPRRTGTEEFTPRTLTQEKSLHRRLYWLVVVPLALGFNILSLKIIADFFPSTVVVRGWQAVFIGAAILTLTSQMLSTFISFISKQSRSDWAFLAQWIF